jgi:RNA polymerase sigma-70 factor, ECF subfamily
VELKELALDMADWQESAEKDTDSFEDAMRRHQRAVLMTAYRITGSMDDAQDAAQDAFFRLYRHWRRIDREHVMAWLYRTTINVCHDQRQRRRRESALPDGFDRAAEAAPDAAERDSMRALLLRALARLPEQERAAVVLREIEGRPTAEVAKILGSSEVTVRSQVSRARVKLRGLLDGLIRRRS